MCGPYVVFVPIVAAIVAFLLVTSPIDPSPYTFLFPAPALEGVLAPNSKLSAARRLHEGLLNGPESLAHDPQSGKLYTGTSEGLIWELSADGSTAEPLVQTGEHDPLCGTEVQLESKCGRPCGMKMDKAGYLIVADASKGLLRVDVKHKTIEVLLPGYLEIAGQPLRFLNAVEVAKNGTIYFTSSSTKWDRKDYRYAVIELDRTGRVFAYNPVTKDTQVLASGLSLANGLVLTKDESALLVSEMTLHRVSKLHVAGPTQGRLEILMDNLPGYPDNIKVNGRGTYFIGILIPRYYAVGPLGIVLTPILDLLAPHPRTKKLFVQVMPFWAFDYFLPRRAYFLEMSEEGKILASFHDPDASVIRHVGEAYHVGGKVYLTGVDNPYLVAVEEKDLL